MSTVFYKHQSSNRCVTSCVSGYYGDDASNECRVCQGGCVSCEFNASYCYSCAPFSGNDYFKVMGANRCAIVCPDGTYGDPGTYSCISCPYFTYQGQCLLTCPNETNVDSTTGRTICKNCSTSANTCEEKYQFNLKTTVSEDGQSLIHNVYLPEGLSSQIS